VHWDGRAASGARLPAGVYVARLRVGESTGRVTFATCR
jgi:hypothetical protein